MSQATNNTSASQEIDAIIKKFGDWRGERLSQIRKLINEAEPNITEEVKWKAPSNPDGVPVWYCEGMICTGETYKKHLRISFTKGPELKEHDPKGIINSYRAMIVQEDDTIDESAFKDVIRAAVKLNKKSKTK